eukprot:COSAG02_NODE_1345_length_13143_cov_61.223091_1_plen_194_part_00
MAGENDVCPGVLGLSPPLEVAADRGNALGGGCHEIDRLEHRQWLAPDRQVFDMRDAGIGDITHLAAARDDAGREAIEHKYLVLVGALLHPSRVMRRRAVPRVDRPQHLLHDLVLAYLAQLRHAGISSASPHECHNHPPPSQGPTHPQLRSFRHTEFSLGNGREVSSPSRARVRFGAQTPEITLMAETIEVYVY